MQLPQKTRRQKKPSKMPSSRANSQPQNWFSKQLLCSNYSTPPILQHTYTLIEYPVRAPCSHLTSTQQGIKLTSEDQLTIPANPTTGTHLPEKGSQKKKNLGSNRELNLRQMYLMHLLGPSLIFFLTIRGEYPHNQSQSYWRIEVKWKIERTQITI